MIQKDRKVDVLDHLLKSNDEKTLFSIQHPPPPLLLTTSMRVHNRAPHNAKRHEPPGQDNEKYPNIGTYTSIYTIRETVIYRHHDSAMF